MASSAAPTEWRFSVPAEPPGLRDYNETAPASGFPGALAVADERRQRERRPRDRPAGRTGSPPLRLRVQSRQLPQTHGRPSPDLVQGSCGRRPIPRRCPLPHRAAPSRTRPEHRSSPDRRLVGTGPSRGRYRLDSAQDADPGPPRLGGLIWVASRTSSRTWKRSNRSPPTPSGAPPGALTPSVQPAPVPPVNTSSVFHKRVRGEVLTWGNTGYDR